MRLAHCLRLTNSTWKRGIRIVSCPTSFPIVEAERECMVHVDCLFPSRVCDTVLIKKQRVQKGKGSEGGTKHCPGSTVTLSLSRLCSGPTRSGRPWAYS